MNMNELWKKCMYEIEPDRLKHYVNSLLQSGHWNDFLTPRSMTVMEFSQPRKVCLNDTREISPNFVPQKGEVFWCFSHLSKTTLVVVQPQYTACSPSIFLALTQGVCILESVIESAEHRLRNFLCSCIRFAGIYFLEIWDGTTNNT